MQVTLKALLSKTSRAAPQTYSCRFLCSCVFLTHFKLFTLSSSCTPPKQITNQKIDIKVEKGKIGSLDNVKHRPGGGDKKVFNDVEYLRQMSETAGAQLLMNTSGSGPNSREGSRRESAVQVIKV